MRESARVRVCLCHFFGVSAATADYSRERATGGDREREKQYIIKSSLKTEREQRERDKY